MHKLEKYSFIIAKISLHLRTYKLTDRQTDSPKTLDDVTRKRGAWQIWNRSRLKYAAELMRSAMHAWLALVAVRAHLLGALVDKGVCACGYALWSISATCL